MKNILFVGAGAQAKYASECFAQLEDYRVRLVLANEGSPHMDWPKSYNADYDIGFDKLEKHAASGIFDGALACIADTETKASLQLHIEKLGLPLVSAIHPFAHISTTAEIGAGTIINAGAVVQPFARVGSGVMVHANVIIEHDCIIEDFANLAPGCQLAGWVTVGRGATVFTGSSVIPGIKIGANATIAAGSAVIKDVPENTLYGGVPARSLSTGKRS